MVDTESASEPVAPLRLGPYKVTGLLGHGGMGVVYRARDAVLSRDVALKVLPVERVNSETSRARMRREAHAQASLAHPNICAVYQSGDDAGRLWIAMELLPGPTLAACAKTAISDDDILRWAKSIARALACAHGAGLVHRDLKPGNVMLDHTGDVKLLDFGLVKIIEPTDSSHTKLTFETEHGAILGTPRYMSPEQARGDDTGPPTDVFALGLVLYDLLAARSARNGAPPTDHRPALLHDLPRVLGRDVDPKLARLIADCLARDPRERPSADSVLARLGQITSTRRSRRRWLHRLGVSAISAAVLAATVGAAMTYRSAAELNLADAIVVTEFDPMSYVTAAAFDRAGRLYYIARNPRSRLWRTRANGGSELVPGVGETHGVSCCYRDMIVARRITGAIGIEPLTDKLVELPELDIAVSIDPTGRVVAEMDHTCQYGFKLRAIESDTALVTICPAPGHFFEAYQWSPNGRRFAYQDLGDHEAIKIFSIDLDAYLTPKLVVTIPNNPVGRPTMGFAWKSNNQLLVHSHGSRREETPQRENTILEIEIDRSGKSVERTRFSLGARFVEPIAASAAAIAILETRPESGLLYGDLTTPLSLAPLAPGNSRLSSVAGWTADGRLVGALANPKTSSTEVAVQSLGGAPSIVVPEDPGDVAFPVALTTFEGVEHIVFQRIAEGKRSLWIVQLDGNRPRVLIPRIEQGAQVACAPGRCVIALPGKSPSSVAMIDLQSGQMSDLFYFYSDDFIRPAVSPDGRLVAAVSSNSTLRVHDRVKGTVEDWNVPGSKGLQSVAFANERDLILTENRYTGGRGIVRLRGDRKQVDVLLADGNWYFNPVIDWVRNRIVVYRQSLPDSLSIVQWP